MIFMIQSGITDPAGEAAWREWYVEHLRIMCTVNGIDSAQRFRTRSSDWPPSLAMYSIRAPEVFVDPYYQKIRGMGPWLDLIDRRYYKRNLFEGEPGGQAVVAPRLEQDEILLVTDQPSAALADSALSFTWLKTVGLDLSTPYRGICVISQAQLRTLPQRADIAIYTPD